MSQRRRLMKQNDQPETDEDIEQQAQQFCDDWELQAMLINDEKLREQ